MVVYATCTINHKDNPMSEQMQNDFQKPTATSKKGGAVRWVVTIVVVVIIILAGLFAVSRYTNFNVLGLASGGQQWQAVFLTNGQVYFGKVTKDTNSQLVLEQIYYLQVTQPLQRSANDQQQQQQQNELALVKLGNELHGPTDQMMINKDHILFIEDLKTDSKVVEAIEQSRQQAAQ